MAKRRGRPSSSHPSPTRVAEKPHPASTITAAGPLSSSAMLFLKKHAVGWLILGCMLPVALCLAKLNDDLWYDEIYTLSFAEQPVTAIVEDYSAPNNHVLFTVLLRPFFMVASSDAVLRLPSFACTIATLTCVFYLGRRAGGVPTAIAAVLGLGLNQMFLGHAMQVRGYSLSMALAAALGLLAVKVESRSWVRATSIILLAAAMMYTIPTNTIVAGSLAVAAIALRWIFTRSWKVALLEAATWAAAAALAALLYSPIYDQVMAARSSAVEGSWAGTLRLIGHFYWAALHDYVFLAPFTLFGIWKLLKDSLRLRPADPQPPEEVGHHVAKSSVLWLCLIVLSLPFLLTAMLKLSPFERVFCPLLPFIGVLLGWGAIEATQTALACWAQRKGRPNPGTGVVTAVGVFLMVLATLPWLITYPQRLEAATAKRFAQDGYFNYYSANYSPSQVAAYLRSRVSPDLPYIIAFEDADMLNVRWYLAQENVTTARLMDTPQGETVARVFLVLPPRPNFDRVKMQTGLSEEALRSLPLAADFGYYKVFSSPGLMRVWPASHDEHPSN